MICYVIIFLIGNKECCFVVNLWYRLYRLVYPKDQFGSFAFCSTFCCEVLFYADDAEMHFSQAEFNVVKARLLFDLNDVAHWLCSSQLCLNVVKSNLREPPENCK